MTMYPTSTQGYNHAPPPPMYSQPAGYPQYPPPQYPAHVSGGIHPAYPPNPAYAMWWETHNLKKKELFVRYNAEALDVLYIIFQKFKKCIPYILHEGWLNLPGELFFFLKTRTSYYMYTYMCDVSRLRHLTLYILKIKMSFLLHIGRRCLALYNVHFSNNKKYTPYQQPVLLGCGIFFHRVKNNVRCLWINSILYFSHVQQCLFNACN